MVIANSYGMVDPSLTVSFSFEQAELLADVLDMIVQSSTRAPRPPLSPTDPAYPVTNLSAAQLQMIESIVCSLRSTLGNVIDSGSCFASIVSVLDIDNAELNVIQWLKTLMREFRGVCP